MERAADHMKPWFSSMALNISWVKLNSSRCFHLDIDGNRSMMPRVRFAKAVSSSFNPIMSIGLNSNQKVLRVMPSPMRWKLGAFGIPGVNVLGDRKVCESGKVQ